MIIKCLNKLYRTIYHDCKAKGAFVPPSAGATQEGFPPPAEAGQYEAGLTTIDEFDNFEGYMEKVEAWGVKSGIVKIVPPKEWCVIEL